MAGTFLRGEVGADIGGKAAQGKPVIASAGIVLVGDDRSAVLCSAAAFIPQGNGEIIAAQLQ